MRAYAAKTKNTNLGKSTKIGILDVKLELNDAIKTVVTKQFSQPPFQLQRALYTDESIPCMAYLYMISTSGGILQGDRYLTNIVLENNAIAHITTQGATRVYGMYLDFASQTINITVGKNCYLEYIPDQIIPYKNSRYYQKVNLNVHNDSTLVYSEVLTPGRIAMNEYFNYNICYLQTNCKKNGKISFLENMKIEPKKQPMKKFGIFGDYQIVGTVYILTKNNLITELENIINKEIHFEHGFFGTSILSYDLGIIVRILGKRTDDVFDIIFKILKLTRKNLLGHTFNGIRKS